MEDVLEFKGRVENYRYKNEENGFAIATMNVDKVLEGEPKFTLYGDLVFKGNFDLMTNTTYIIKGKYSEDPKFGPQYEFMFSKREKPIEDMSASDFRHLLEELMPHVGMLINKAYKDSRQIFEDNDLEKLLKVKGVGPKNASKILARVESQKDFGPAYVAFGKWGFTMSTTRKIVRAKKSVEAAIKVLEQNPYDLMRIVGIGFKTIDTKALKMGIAANDPRRVHAFVKDYFDNLEMSGSSWISPDDLTKYLHKEIFDCDVVETLTWIKNSDDFIIYQQDGAARIAPKYLYDAETKVADNLVRVLDGKAKMELKDVDETIKKTEEEQGFGYSPKQLEGIKTMLDSKVVLLRGVAGSGKSSTINAVIKVFKHNHLSIASCALSGKAADNLSQITGMRGSTIHRLLKVTPHGMYYNEKNYLPYDVVVLDEVSMVDVKLFKALTDALSDRARLIMIGDSAQLDSIGVGVMREIVDAKVVPVVTLNEIHRQAKKSAIVTHSLTYRVGKLPQVSPKDSWKMVGGKRDLGYVFEEDESRLFDDTYKVFKSLLQDNPVNDVQIITQTTSNCLKINRVAQQIANPDDGHKESYEVYPGKEYGYVLREGDKVLNTVNNYKTVSADNETNILPIFNGNTGTIEKIDIEKDGDGKVSDVEMVIKFDGVGRVLVRKAAIKNIQLGYAMTVHKSQGSTIPNVIVMLPYQYMLNSRELLYTAMTRSSNKCFILTSIRTLKAAVNKTSETVHHSNLAPMLKEVSAK